MEKVTDFTKDKDMRIAAFYDRLQKVIDDEKTLPYATLIGVVDILKDNLKRKMHNDHRD